MKFTKLTVGKSIETVNKFGLKSWNKVAIEVDLEGGSPEDAYTEASKFVNEKLSQPTENQEEEIIQKEKPKLTGMEHWISEINKCTTIEKPDGIESFRAIADSNPKLKEVFNKKLKQLQDGTK